MLQFDKLTWCGTHSGCSLLTFALHLAEDEFTKCVCIGTDRPSSIWRRVWRWTFKISNLIFISRSAVIFSLSLYLSRSSSRFVRVLLFSANEFVVLSSLFFSVFFSLSLFVWFGIDGACVCVCVPSVAIWRTTWWKIRKYKFIQRTDK